MLMVASHPRFRKRHAVTEENPTDRHQRLKATIPASLIDSFPFIRPLLKHKLPGALCITRTK